MVKKKKKMEREKQVLRLSKLQPKKKKILIKSHSDGNIPVKVMNITKITFNIA